MGNVFIEVGTVIFDFDGTLADSMVHWKRVMADHLAPHGVSMDNDLFCSLKPLGISKASEVLVDNFKLELDPADLSEVFKESMGILYQQSIPLKPGAADLIKALSSEGMEICVATAIHKPFAKAALKRTGVLDDIDCLVTTGELGCTKHDPDIFLACSNRFGRDPEDCLVFEDSAVSCEVAARAGFRVVGVWDPTNSAEDDECMASVCEFRIGNFTTIKSIKGGIII